MHDLVGFMFVHSMTAVLVQSLICKVLQEAHLACEDGNCRALARHCIALHGGCIACMHTGFRLWDVVVVSPAVTSSMLNVDLAVLTNLL